MLSYFFSATQVLLLLRRLLYAYCIGPSANMIIGAIPIRVLAPAIAVPRQRSAVTFSDWNLRYLRSTAFFPARFNQLQWHHAGAGNSFLPNCTKVYLRKLEWGVA